MCSRCVNTIFNNKSLIDLAGGIVETTVPAGPKISAPRFGKWIEEQRGDRTYEQVALKVRPLVKSFGLKVNRSAIKKYELGRIPPWPMLYALSEVFGEAPGVVATRLFSAIQVDGGRDLLRHGADQGSAPGGVDVPASDPARRLESIAQNSATLADQVHDALSVLTSIESALRKQARTLAPGEPGRRGRDRKTG